MDKEILKITEIASDGNYIVLSDGKKYLVRSDGHAKAKAWSVGRLVVVKEHGQSNGIFELRVGKGTSGAVLAAVR